MGLGGWSVNLLSSAATARIFAAVHSKRTRVNGHNLQKGELTRCKETFLPLEGDSVVERVPREAGELPVWEKFRSYLMNAQSNLISSFSINLL